MPRDPAHLSLVKHLSYANVMSTLCLVLVICSGTALAAGTIRSRDIVNGQVKAADLGRQQVTAAKIRDRSVGASKLATGAVTGTTVLDGSLTAADLAGADVEGGGISVPAAYVPVGRCRQLDASVGGAKAGEAVVFSVQAAVQDGVVIYGQRVPSDGHVMFDVCNFSGTTQAAVVDLPVRIITFG
jgi:hypothetical protein